MRTTKYALFSWVIAACTAPEAGRPEVEPSAATTQAQPATSEAGTAEARSRTTETVRMIGNARAAIDNGRPRDALIEIDALAERAPDDPRVWLMRGEACLNAAANDSEPAFYYADALTAFERALALGGGRAALLGASVASRMKLLPDQALDYARRAIEGVARPEPWERRIAIEATFDAYIQRMQSNADAAELYKETEAQLLELLADTPDDPWALHTLANLFQWGGQRPAAVEPLAHLIDVAPDDEGAHNRFIAVLREVEGREGVIAHYYSYRSRHPDVALGAWYLAVETFEKAVDDLWAQRDATAGFLQAGDHFIGCRVQAAQYEDACKGYEVMCHNGAGWCRFNAGDLDGAARAFFAMEDALPGGVQWQIEGRLLSGVKGLQLVADRALREDSGSGDQASTGTARAMQIYQRLRELVPNDSSIANNCGFFLREYGVARLASSREARREAASETDAAQKAALEARAASELAEAQRVLSDCRDAYLAAARLAPEDVRIVNDTALILVYHFPSQVDEAERLLVHAVEAGRAQKDDAALDDGARDALLEAWGDAHQNLGVVYLMHRKDPARAREWFQQSFEIGPRPRVDRAWISEVALPWCERVAAGETLDPLALDERIGFVE